MASQSRLIDRRRKPGDREVPIRETAPNSRRGQASRLLRAASAILVCAVLAGCSTLHLPFGGTVRHDAARQSAKSSPSKKSRHDKSWWSSWFGPQEPPPPKSVKEWMERTERIRLEDDSDE